MTTRVILYSGGLDSFAGFHLLNKRNPGEWTKAYARIGSRYEQKELAHLPGDVYLSENIRIGRLERPDGFVPQRNVLLVTNAQAVWDADEIALCGVRGEYSRDKHPAFYREMTKLLTYTAGKPVRVFSPFERMTKTQALRAAIRAGASIDALLATVSCYSPGEVACGECMSCFRRWTALENNNLTQEWARDPWQTTFASASNLRKLPVGMMGDFARAQWDVVTAYGKLWRRTYSAKS